MNENIDKTIFEIIKKTEDYYNIQSKKMNINVENKDENKDESTNNKPKTLNPKHRREIMALNNLNYKFNEMKKQKDDKDYLNNKQKRVEIIDNYSEIDYDDSINKNWIKLDNWQKKQKINAYCEKYPKSDRPKISQFIASLIKEKKISNREIDYNKSIGKIEEIKSEKLDNFIKNLMV